MKLLLLFNLSCYCIKIYFIFVFVCLKKSDFIYPTNITHIILTAQNILFICISNNLNNQFKTEEMGESTILSSCL